MSDSEHDWLRPEEDTESETIIDARTVYPDVWVGGEVNADGVTVMPYIGSDCCAVSEGKAAFAAVRTANPSAAQLQNLMAGDRKLYAAAAGQMARHGAALLVETGYSLDIKELRRRYPESNIVAVDYDPGASEVNQLNRIKLMIAVAKSNLADKEAEARAARTAAATPAVEEAGALDVQETRA